jgi:ATP-dependent RNA helicase RhlE
MGYTATEIHSTRSLNQRIQALEGFKIGRFRVMIATDIAARGIDVTGIQVVINYDLPATGEDYVHRIGRTGRAGMTGHAITFASSNEKGDVRGIERLIRKTLTVSKTPGDLPTVDMPRMERDDRPPRRDQRRPFGAGRSQSQSQGTGQSRGNPRGPRPQGRGRSFAPAGGARPESPQKRTGGSGGRGRFSRDKRSREPEYKKPSRPIYSGDGGYFLPPRDNE